jgi:hypothetical protein
VFGVASVGKERRAVYLVGGLTEAGRANLFIGSAFSFC